MFLCSRGAKTCGPIKCLVSSQLAEISSKYLKKGGKVYVEGSLCTGKWKD
ncbi:single-stranded DNA-binding protein [Acinetobacter baumannii]|nr:single-stranded DNA-binding protein [Acinetobacter baumannii]EKU5326643.1 single-stranded DNA-binding protein [Acinetobacter baumannii]EKU9033287.1 single-stranded DNA-binding protein [Acinetobacter baumannii]EKV0238715.1 single-stranded DNA-binding protein [Acinetobacter baumannii]EKV5225859.1 single-stranded DNA-binding protein [Acinetobacter baumannii]